METQRSHRREDQRIAIIGLGYVGLPLAIALARRGLNVLGVDVDARKIAVLGDMYELGSYEDEGHRIVGRRAREVAHLLVVVGTRDRCRLGGLEDTLYVFADMTWNVAVGTMRILHVN